MERGVVRRGSTALPRAADGRGLVVTLAAVLAVLASARGWARDAVPDGYLFHDSHVHLTNYVQQGTDIRKYLEIMGDKVGRSTVCGIPLQQTWSYGNSGDFAPSYYLQSDAPLYYYSFTDAGIASLTDPALDRILDFAVEVGLVVILHSDVDMPFAKAGAEPVFPTQMKGLLRRHPKATIIWAHIGLGHVVHQVQGQATMEATERNPTYAGMVEARASDPALRHVYYDISWDEVAKYAVASPEASKNTSAILNKCPDRFLFGTDNVAPAAQATRPARRCAPGKQRT